MGVGSKSPDTNWVGIVDSMGPKVSQEEGELSLPDLGGGGFIKRTRVLEFHPFSHHSPAFHNPRLAPQPKKAPEQYG
jgi:hypothetical protein